MKTASILVAAIALAFANPASAWELSQGGAGPALTCNFSTIGVPSECQTCYDKPSQKIIFALPLHAIKDISSDFFGGVYSGALGAARQLGVPISIRGNDIEDLNCDNIESYGQLIRDAAAEKPAGLVIIPAIIPKCNSTDVADALREAAASGVPLIAINSNPDVGRELGASLYVGQDEVLAGEEACAALSQAAGGKNATILFIDVVNGVAPGINARLEGCKKNATSVVVMSTNTRIAANDTALIVEQLKKNPNVNVILANGGTAHVQAMIAAADQTGKVIGKDIWLATTDWSPLGTAQALSEGKLEFIVDQQAPLQGAVPVQLLALKQVTGGLPRGDVLTGPSLVRPNGTFASQGLSSCSSYARPICGSCEGTPTDSPLIIENGVWSIDQDVGGNAMCGWNTSSVIPPECPVCISNESSKIILALPFIEFNQSANLFWVQVIGGAANTAASIGAELSVRGVDGKAQDCDAVAKYPELLRAAAAEKPQGLIVVPLQTASCDVDILGAIKEISSSGVPIVAINSNPEAAIDAGALTYVGQDEVKAGEEACAALAAAAGGNATVLFMDINVGQNPGLNARRAGCEAVADAVVAMPFTDTDLEADVAAVAAKLKENPKINAILAMGSPNQVNLMIQAAAAAGRTINSDLWLGIGGWTALNTTQALADGTLQFVIDQGALSQGAIPVLALSERAATGLFPSQPLLYTGPTLVTANNSEPGVPSACNSFGLPYCNVCEKSDNSGSGSDATSGSHTLRGTFAGCFVAFVAFFLFI